MGTHATAYLASLEQTTRDQDDDSFYLWPATPIEDFQKEIHAQVGVSDRHPRDPRSRPASITRFIAALRSRDLVPTDFTMVDVCCGDALVIGRIKQSFPHGQCYGVDILKDQIASHLEVLDAGVELFKIYIQQLFRADPEEPFDVAIMLNTYRGWPAASLRDHEQDLPVLAHRWLLRNARYAVVTARESQIHELVASGKKVIRLGPGEESSTMIGISEQPFPLRSVLRHYLLTLRLKIRLRLLRLKRTTRGLKSAVA